MRKILGNSLLFSLFILSLFFSGCVDERSNNLDPSLFGYEYYPIEVGKYWIYQMDSTIIDDGGNTRIENTSFIKEEIIDTFQNNLGEAIFVIERSGSSTVDGNYVVTDAWTAEFNDDRAVKTEENLRFIKLIFPADIDVNWQGNQFDELIQVDVAGEQIWVYKDWGDYHIIATNSITWSNGVKYDNVIIVQQADFESEVERRFSKEYYAPNVGLVRREMTILDTQCLCPGDTWEEKAQAGFILKQQLIETN